MFYNICFIIIFLYAIWVKKGDLCDDCTNNKVKEIFQILLIAILSYVFVGSEVIVKLVAILILSYIVKNVVFYIPRKFTNCFYCHDPWKK